MGGELEFADEYYKAIKRVSVGGPRRQISAFYQIIHLRRSDYRTINQYVRAFRQKAQYSNDMGMPLTAYQCMLMILDGIKPELKVYTQFKLQSFKEDAPETMEWSDFLRLTNEIMDEAIQNTWE